MDEEVEAVCDNCGEDLINNAVFTKRPHWVHLRTYSRWCDDGQVATAARAKNTA